MPNMGNVDERVVQMRMDNEQFERGAERTMGTLEKLKKSMNFSDAKTGNVDLSPVEKTLDAIKGKFNALEYAGKRLVENLTDSAINLAKQAVTQADMIGPGYQKYEDQIQAIQKLIIATGESMDTVQRMSDKVLAFTDETSYSYNSMISTLSSFTSSGMGLKDAENTTLGMAVAAGQAGVSAEQATHAFTGFQKAISQNAMTANTWAWIKTAGMNTAELKQAFLDAGVASGTLEKGADGVYYALEETAKGVKKTEVSIANFDSSFASKWMNADVIQRGMAKYAEAYNQIYKIHEETGKAIWEIIDDESEYIDQIDAYGLAAFRAGQETKTWGESIKALKEAISSGWMKSFELIIGNYEQSRDFFSDLIEPLFTIFVDSKKRRNSFLEAAFGDGSEQSKTIASWDKLIKKLEETDHTTDELETAFRKVAEENTQVRALTEEYGSLEEAIKAGAVGGELLKQILNEINGITTETSEAVADTGAAYQQYLETAWAVLRGDYGNGAERRQALEELGMDYDMVQWLAGNLANGMTLDTLTLDWIAQVAPNHYKQFMEILGQTGSVAGETSQEFIDLADVVEESWSVTENAGKSVREIWQESVLNILHGVADAIEAVGKAFDNVFGDAKTRGEGLRGWANRFYELTHGFEISEDTITSIGEKATSFFTAIKEKGGPALDFLKDLAKKGFANLGKAFTAVRKSIRFVFEVFGDLFGVVKKIFSGNLSLPENLQNSEGLLGKIAQIVTDVINKVGEFSKTFNPFDAISSFIDKLEEIREYFKGGGSLGELIRTSFRQIFNIGEGEQSKGILGFFSQLFGGFGEDSEELSDSLLTISDSMEDVGDSVRGLGDSVGAIGSVLEPVSKLLFGDEGELEAKITELWGRVKSVFVTEYGKINWDTLLDVGKLGLIGLLISKTNSFYNTLTGNLKKGNAKVGTIRGLIGSLQGLSDAVASPFKALSTAITGKEKADRYLKIAAAIGILAWSLVKLTQVDEQKFFNVAVVLGFLMMIMAQMAKAMDGFQLFSNNVKNISKNNQSSFAPVMDIAKQFKNFADFTNASIKINVFSQAAQIIVAVAILLGVIVVAILKLKDIADVDHIKQIWPVLAILGATMLMIGGIAAGLAALTKDAKYLGKAGWVMLMMAASLAIIAGVIKSFAKMNANASAWGAMIGALLMMVFIMGMTAVVLRAAGEMVKQGQSAITSGSAVFAIAAVLLSLGIVMRSLVKTMNMASQIQNVWQAIGIMVGAFAAVALILLMIGDLAGNPAIQGGKIAAIAGSLVLIAVAIGLLAVPVGILSALNPAGMLAAAAALGILMLAVAGVVTVLSKIDTKKLLITAAVFGVLAVAIGLLMAAAAFFTSTMIAMVTGVPWEDLQERVKAFDTVLRPELGLLLGLGAAALMFGIGCAGAALAAGVFGASFLAIAAGIYLVAAALPKLIDGIIYFIQQLQEHGWEIVKFIALVFSVILAVMIAHKLQLAETVVGIVMTVVERLKDGVLIGKMLSVLGLFLEKGLAFLIAMAPLLSEKLVKLIANLVWSLASALNSNAGYLIAAFESLIGTLLTIAIKALVNLSGDLWGFLVSFIGEIIAGILDKFHAGGLAGKVRNWVNEVAEGFEGASSLMSEAADRALENSFNKSDYKPNIETEATITVTDADVEFKPGDEATIEFEEPMTVPLNSENTQFVVEDTGFVVDDTQLIIEDLTKELTGEGESDGMPGAMEAGWDSMAATGLPENDLTKIISDENGAGPQILGAFGSFMGSDDAKSSLITSITGLFSGATGDEGFLGSLKGFGDNTAGTWISAIIGKITGQESVDSMQAAGGVPAGEATTGFNDYATGDNPINAGKNLLSGILEGIQNSELVQKLYNAMFNNASTAISGWDDRTRSASPSKEMIERGGYAIQGLIIGMQNGEDGLYNETGEIGSKMLNSMSQTMAQVAAIASEDFEFSPTITPVVDLSNVTSAASTMNSALGRGFNVSAQMAGNIGRRMNDAERIAGSMETRTGGSTVNSNDSYVINIYTSEGMDENAVADAVIDRLGNRYARRGVAFG